VSDGKSLWPEPTEYTAAIQEITFAESNPWYRKLIEVQEAIVKHAAGRYAVSLSHLRGPADILAALLGTQRFLIAMYDEPWRIERLAGQIAAVWLRVTQGQEAVVPAFRGGYGIRQFGLWSPGRSVWLQDDTSGMMSLHHYRRFFLGPLRSMSVYPFGVLHLHAHSLHLAEALAAVPGIRAINIYFDTPAITIADALPVLRQLQQQRMPLILARDVYQGFSLEEYAEIMDALSPRGLSVHMRADSVEEGRAVMAAVKARARRSGTLEG
jgi:hypothetical protein